MKKTKKKVAKTSDRQPINFFGSKAFAAKVARAAAKKELPVTQFVHSCVAKVIGE